MSDEIIIIEIDGSSDDPFGPCWGVLDPRHALYDLWQNLIGQDFLPMLDALPRYVGSEDDPRKGFRVDHTRLTPDQLTTVCRHIARATRMTELEAFFDITRGAGCIIAARAIHLCPDPEIGRAWYRARDQAEAEAGKPTVLRQSGEPIILRTDRLFDPE